METHVLPKLDQIREQIGEMFPQVSWVRGRSIAVLLPCYNEAASIGDVVQAFRRALPAAQIYVYDNNSTDGTSTAAKKAGAVVRTERYQGKGNVVLFPAAVTATSSSRISCRERLGGLLRYYSRAA